MTDTAQPSPRIAIACGGTGGHLFPGLAVAGELVRRGCAVTLLISPKDVDQQAVKAAAGIEVATLPAVGLKPGGELAFLRGFGQSYRAAKSMFKTRVPQAVLAMGGFTSAPPILVAKQLGVRTFLHESNTIPGRANRWLSWIADYAFVGFPSAASRLHNRRVTVTGTPVRSQFQPRAVAACRASLGLDQARPVLLVMGGSQGASGINSLIVKSLPLLAKRAPDLQYVHLAGPDDEQVVRQAYLGLTLRATVHSFLSEIELALAAATAAISRAGASSLAELAAMRLPAVLVPYPDATDNHQLHNARAFEATGAARLLEQKAATPESLTHLLLELVRSASSRERIQSSLSQWHAPNAAAQIAETMLEAVGVEAREVSSAGLSQGIRMTLEECQPTDLKTVPSHVEPSDASRSQFCDTTGCKFALPRERQAIS